jgi:hypothetical protein
MLGPWAGGGAHIGHGRITTHSTPLTALAIETGVQQILPQRYQSILRAGIKRYHLLPQTFRTYLFVDHGRIPCYDARLIVVPFGYQMIQSSASEHRSKIEPRVPIHTLLDP